MVCGGCAPGRCACRAILNLCTLCLPPLGAPCAHIWLPQVVHCVSILNFEGGVVLCQHYDHCGEPEQIAWEATLARLLFVEDRGLLRDMAFRGDVVRPVGYVFRGGAGVPRGDGNSASFCPAAVWVGSRDRVPRPSSLAGTTAAPCAFTTLLGCVWMSVRRWEGGNPSRLPHGGTRFHHCAVEYVGAVFVAPQNFGPDDLEPGISS
jgi:hypothetical protein